MKLYAGTSDEKTESFTGMALGIPIGAALYLSEDFYLQGTYTLSYMGTTPLRDDIAHSFMLGLGFQWDNE